MKKYNFKKWIILLISVKIFLPTSIMAQEGDYNETNYVRCAYPLDENMTWDYDILDKGEKKGELNIKVIAKGLIEKPHQKHPKYTVKINTYTLQISDTYLKKNYTKKITTNSGYDIYIENPVDKKYYPFMSGYLSKNMRINHLMVMEISAEEFMGEKRQTATLLSTTKPDYIEMYMQRVGLFYYKNKNVEYKLQSTTIVEHLKDKRTCY